MNKTLKISEEAHEKLMLIGQKGESFDDIIKRIIKEVLKNDTKTTKRK